MLGAGGGQPQHHRIPLLRGCPGHRKDTKMAVSAAPDYTLPNGRTFPCRTAATRARVYTDWAKSRWAIPGANLQRRLAAARRHAGVATLTATSPPAGKRPSYGTWYRPVDRHAPRSRTEAVVGIKKGLRKAGVQRIQSVKTCAGWISDAQR